MFESMLAALTGAASSVQSRAQNGDADTSQGEGSAFQQVLEGDADLADPLAIAASDLALAPHTDSRVAAGTIFAVNAAGVSPAQSDLPIAIAHPQTAPLAASTAQPAAGSFGTETTNRTLNDATRLDIATSARPAPTHPLSAAHESASRLALTISRDGHAPAGEQQNLENTPELQSRQTIDTAKLTRSASEEAPLATTNAASPVTDSDATEGLAPVRLVERGIVPADGRAPSSETGRSGYAAQSAPSGITASKLSPTPAESAKIGGQAHGHLDTTHSVPEGTEIASTRDTSTIEDAGEPVSIADQNLSDLGDAQSPRAIVRNTAETPVAADVANANSAGLAREAATNTPEAPPRLERSAATDVATPSETRLTSDIEPQTKTAINVAAGVAEASVANTSTPLTAASAPITLTATTTPSFNPVATPNNPQPIIASPADIPDVVAQTLAQNESTERISIQLDPPELGRVSIEFQIDDSGVHTVTVTSETSEALRKLRMMNFELLQALEQQGLAGRGFSLEYQHSGDADAWNGLNQETANETEGEPEGQTDAWSSNIAQNTRTASQAITADGGLNLRL